MYQPKELRFKQIATSESSSMDGSNGENLYGLTNDGVVYYYSSVGKIGSPEWKPGWKKLSDLNLDNDNTIQTPN